MALEECQCRGGWGKAKEEKMQSKLGSTNKLIMQCDYSNPKKELQHSSGSSGRTDLFVAAHGKAQRFGPIGHYPAIRI